MLTLKHLENMTGAIVTSQIMRFLIAVVELVMLFVVLAVILVLSPFSALVVALVFCLLGLRGGRRNSDQLLRWIV
ncbi:uncharacterized protein YqfA (UPF0365 family) [Roseovarius sp. MBR-154]|jgi:hypothetical protein